MNRGHALQQAGQLDEAIAAYAQAIAALRDLPFAENPAWANSLGAAWMNHGQLLHRAHGIARTEEALASFDAAAAVLRAIPAGENPWVRRNLAGTLLNRANLLLDLGQSAAAATVAREALAPGLPHERRDPVDADLALKARRALCDALGQLLIAPGANQDALATEASDLVDDALALIRHWNNSDPAAFRPLAIRFFRYGAQLYRFHQPHFLAEFIEENLPPTDAEFRTIALEALNAALADQPRGQPYLTVGDPVSERRLQTWRALEALRRRLAA